MIETILVLGFCILLGALLTRLTKIPAPLTLIFVGLVLSLLPGIGHIVSEAQIEPEVVLSVMLPFLLYWEALNISLRGIRQMLRGVLVSGTVMVIAVAMAEGFIGSWLGLSVGVAFLVGAAVAPTDATAVAAFGKGISPNVLLALRAESLINDGTALVIFAVACNYAAGNTDISPLHIGGNFLISFIGAALVGIAVGYVVSRLGRFVQDPMIGNVCRILVPFIAYFLAEEIGASGVLATVVVGLVIGQTSAHFVTTGSRVTGRHFWIVSCYILNAVLFVIVGIQLPEVIETLSSDTLSHALMAVVVLYVVMMIARYLVAEFSYQIMRRSMRNVTNLPERILYAAAGFRGAISLAVALSIPHEIPGRDLVVFITAGIVILSLIIQGIAVPYAIKLTQRHPNPHNEANRLKNEAEVRNALTSNYKLVLQELSRLNAEAGGDEELEQRLRSEFERGLADYSRGETGVYENRYYREEERRLRLAIIAMGREHLTELRDRGELDDEAYNELVDIFDLAELNISGPISAE
ncbi:MAG: Na+/H+ antiporter [Corynebacterium sp.]|nr:Na+/H+ antiporter [Corynebacterium sp.]